MNFSSVLRKLENAYGTRVRVVFRQFPLSFHEHAREAALASEAAGLQGRFWEMHDLLYQNSALWSRAPDVRPVFNVYAGLVGLDIGRFTRDMDSEEVKARVTADEAYGTSLGVEGTPTVFLNHRKVRGIMGKGSVWS